MDEIKLVKGKESRSVYEIWEKNKYVDDIAMVNEISKKTHLPKWICRKVYEAEANILNKLGLLH